MLTGPVYTANFAAIAVTVAQDLLTITASSGQTLEIVSAFVGQSSDAGDAQAEMLRINFTRYATAGSGGTAITELSLRGGQATAAAAVVRNNTTVGGTPTLLLPETFNVQVGWFYKPVPDERITVPPSGILAINLPVAPTDSLTMSGYIIWKELL